MVVYSDRNLFTESFTEERLQIYYVICSEICDLRWDLQIQEVYL